METQGNNKVANLDDTGNDLWGDIDCQSLIDEFKENGFVVVPIFTEEEVVNLREAFHKELEVDHIQLLSGDKKMLEKMGGVRAKSKASTIFCPKWKLDALTHPRIIDFYTRLLRATFISREPGYEHPLGYSSDALLYLDGTAYRLPDHIQAEGGLGLHLDRNPYDPYLLCPTVTKKLLKYRPIQSWIGLTDHYGSKSGGIRIVRGFHKEIDNYFKRGLEFNKSHDIESAGGEFYRLNPNSHAKLWSRAEPVDVPAGSMILWDNRLPHSTAEHLVGDDTREVLYFSYVPDIALNKGYCDQQRFNILHQTAPPQYLDRVGSSNPKIKVDWEVEDLTPTQRKVLGF